MDVFKGPRYYIKEYIVTEGFKILKKKGGKFPKSSKTQVHLFELGDEIYVGKGYLDGDLLKIVKEYLLEENMKNFFTIGPKNIFKTKMGKYYIMMEKYLPLSDFFSFFGEDLNEDLNEEIRKDINLSTLTIFVSLFVAINSLHVQKNPTLHHDLKPLNILIIPYRFVNGEFQQVKIPPGEDYKHEIGTIYIARLIDFDLAKENNLKSNSGYTLGYRTFGLYTEFSDIFSLAVILEMFIYGYTIFQNFFDAKPENLIIEMFGYFVSKFSFKDKSKITGLEKIVDMLLECHQNKDYNLPEIINILTTPDQLTEILPPDFIDDERLNIYFKILEIAKIRPNLNSEYKKIAPRIFGPNYDCFLFAMYHQKGNDLDLQMYQNYQKNIVKKWKQNLNQEEKIEEIAKLHYDMNFFDLKKQIDEFNAKYQIDATSKLFKILISLDFKNTRTLYNFANALSYSTSYISYEKKYRLKLLFGKNYKAKVGFILLNTENSEPQKALDSIMLEALNVTELLTPFDISNFGVDIDISLSDIILNDFNEFLSVIKDEHKDDKQYSKQCKDKFLSMIYNNDRQNALHAFFIDEYGESSPIILFVYYLVFYEIKCEDAQKNDKDVDLEISTTQCSSTITETSAQAIDKYMFTVPRDDNDKIRIDWYILYRLNEIKESVLSQELIERYKKYFPVINFLKSLNVSLYDFHIFLQQLYVEKRIGDFMQIIQNFDEDSTTSKLQFLESINLLSLNFLECIFKKMKKTNNELLKYISIDDFDKKLVGKEDFDYPTKINSTFIFCSYGNIKYKKDCFLFNLIDKIDETNRSKIALCLTHAYTYLMKLPIKLPTKLFENNILIDEKTDLPMIQLKIDVDNNDQKQSEDNYYTIIKKLMKNDDNIYFNIIQNMFNEFHLPIQHFFNFFINKTFNFTFNETNMKDYNKFVDKTIKNSFYNEEFAYFAEDLLGQSYVFVLDYLFKTNKATKAKNDFVNEMNEITKNIKSYKLIEDHDALSKISALFIKYFDEDLFSFIHLLNQLIIQQDKYSTKKIIDSSKNYGKYQYQNELNDKAISNIYHMLNKFISPLSHVYKNDLCFIVPKKKYNKDLLAKNLNKHRFYFSLKSALYYLCKYQDHDLLLKEKLSIDNIYINEMGDAIVLPFFVDETIMNDILDQIKKDLNIEERTSIPKIKYSYANYIPLKNEHIKKLMTIFGFDYLTELNEIINSYSLLSFDKSLIINFHDKLENLVITDEYILELAKRCNKLWPMFIHILKKATYSNDINIRNEAERLLKIYRSINEINPDEVEKNGKLINKVTGEATIYSCSYKNETIVFKQIRTDLNPYVYLERIINMLFILKSFDEKQVNKHVIKEIGFTNFGPLMNYYPSGNLNEYLDTSNYDKNGLFWLKFIYRLADDIYLLHKNKIVHNDITPSNILIDNNSLPLLSDMINIHHESSFIQSCVKTEKYTPKYYKLRMEKDVYGFEMIVIEIINKKFKKGEIDCPLLNVIRENIKKNDDESNKDNTKRSIEQYCDLMKNNMMYLLKKNSSDKEKKDMDRKFKNFVNGLDTDQNKSFINLLNNEINEENFFQVVDDLKELRSDNIINIDYIKELASFAEKISKINLDKNEEHFTYILNLIDEKIKDDLEKNKKIYFMQKNKVFSCYERIGNLIFQRFYLYGLNGIDDNDFLIEMIFCLNESFKAKEIDEVLFSKINFIVNILEEKENRLVGYFYRTFIHGKKSNCGNLEKNIVFPLKAILFIYSNAVEDNKEINIKKFEDLIMNIFDILIKHDDKKAEFMNFIQTNDPEKEIIKDNVISLFYHTYKHYSKKYSDLSLMFDQIEDFAADSIIPKYKDLPSNNKYMKSLIDSVVFKNKDGGTLSSIMKKSLKF